jgi:hypothetical protein
MGLVKTEQHLFGENVTHLRLEGPALELVPAQAQPGVMAQGNPVLPAAGKAMLTGTGIPKSGNLPGTGDPLLSGSSELTPPASDDPAIPGIGNPPGEKLGNKWQKLAHAKKTATKPFATAGSRPPQAGSHSLPQAGRPGCPDTAMGMPRTWRPTR